ncbi:hypothetical protein EDF20_2525 [Frigoribacterium sp. PhB116]|nr:hypothetical protein EDF20_2525 [Frigoribacterium sp. PhB116]
MMKTSVTRTLPVALGIVLLGAALAGCTSPGDEAGASASSGGTDMQAYEKWESDYRACFSKAGFELPMDGQIDFGDRQGEYESVMAQCDDEVGPPPGADREETPEEKAAAKEASAAEEKCYLDAGYTPGTSDDPDAFSHPEDAPDDLVSRCADVYVDTAERALDR